MYFDSKGGKELSEMLKKLKGTFGIQTILRKLSKNKSEKKLIFFLVNLREGVLLCRI